MINEQAVDIVNQVIWQGFCHAERVVPLHVCERESELLPDRTEDGVRGDCEAIPILLEFFRSTFMSDDPTPIIVNNITRLPGSDGNFWHNDWRWWTHPLSKSEQLVYVGMNLYLCDVEAAMGRTAVIPRSHTDLSLHSRDPHEERDDVHIMAKTGDVLVFDPRICHKWVPNTSDRKRPALGCLVLARKEYYRELGEFPVTYLWPRDITDQIVRDGYVKRDA